MNNYQKTLFYFLTAAITMIYGIIFVVLVFVQSSLQREVGNWYSLFALYIATLLIFYGCVFNKEWLFYASFVSFGIALYCYLADYFGGDGYWRTMLPTALLPMAVGLIITTSLGYRKVGIFAQKGYYRKIHVAIIVALFVCLGFGMLTMVVGKTYKPYVFLGGTLVTLGSILMIFTVGMGKTNVEKRISDNEEAETIAEDKDAE